MRLYAWQPRGHGEQSVFVMARDLRSARLAVLIKLEEVSGSELDYDFEGFDTKNYGLTIASEGSVILNDNQ